jgi:hypothetical protein
MTLMKRAAALALLVLLMVLTVTQAQQSTNFPVYLPLVMADYDPVAENRIINIPYIEVPDMVDSGFKRMAIFWFGQVKPDTNYTDIRVGYNNKELVIHATIFDRRLWYNNSSDGTNLTNWDAVTVTLHTDNATTLGSPSAKSYQFQRQLIWWEEAAIDKYKAAFQGNGSGWVSKSIAFNTQSGWRGGAPNDDLNDHGWTIAFKIPFSSLGMSGPPKDGTFWRLGVVVHDRNSKTGSMDKQVWPAKMHVDRPITWGRVRFGLPGYDVPPASNIKQTTIRHRLNGAVVPDVSAGGGMTCGAGLEPWTAWGNKNYSGEEQFNIQNQKDVSDWPCFSKYFVTFPITSIPPGKVIRSATLMMYQFGGSDPSDAYSSIIQVSTVGEEWNEATLTWNNAPSVLENISQSSVPVFTGSIVWPGAERSWDLSRAVAEAHKKGDPLVRLALYSSDSAMHSGKYFSSSNTGDWNAAGRPTLIIVWGDP